LIEGLPWYLSDLNPRAYFDTSKWLTLDFETTGLEKGSALNKDNRVVLACTKVSDLDSVVEAEPEARTVGRTALARGVHGARILVCHHAKFELQWLRRLGIPTDHLLVLDTMIAEYVIAGNRRWTLDLDSVGRRYGLGGKDPVIDALMRGGVCPSEHPRKRLKARVRLDVETTYSLALAQLVRMDELGLLPVFFTRCIVTPVLAEMEFQGMTLDPVRVREEYDKTMTELAEVERGLAEFAAGTNLRSPKQLAELLYDKLGFEEIKDRRGEPLRNKPSKAQPEGARKTDSDTLEKLKARTAGQRKFVNLRKQWGLLNARITKSLEFFKHVCDEKGGRFYAQIHQTRTQTHRLASSGRRVVFSDAFEGGAQFQNLPREYKKLFTANDGYQLVETDGSGLEFRVAGFLGQDAQAKKDIIEGADVHRYTASIINKKPESEVTKQERTEAKAHTFKPLFAGQSGTKDEQAYYQAFKLKYASIATTQSGWVATVLRSKELGTASGLRFYWPNCKVRADGYVPESTQVYNYPIQSLATADIIPVALVFTYWRTKAAGLRARLTNTVHDSCIAEVHKDDIGEYAEIAVTSFLDNVYDYLEKVYEIDFNMPLGVGMVVGQHWGEGAETSVSYGRR
jgi:DNA polymerase-1